MNLIRKCRHAIYILAACYLIFPTLLFAETATFDTLGVGVIGEEFTDEGITFYNLDNGHPALENIFIIENAEGTITDPSFSPPNGLTASGFGYGAIKEMSMRIDGTEAGSASIEVFTAGTQLYGNTVTLEAIQGGTVVDEVSVVISDLESDHFTLSFDGIVFDELRLVSEPQSQVLLLDNVTITPTGDVGDVCECDLDGNGTCELDDYNKFRENWGETKCGTGPGKIACECDLDGNGACELDDYNIFREDWGRTDCPTNSPD